MARDSRGRFIKQSALKKSQEKDQDGAKEPNKGLPTQTSEISLDETVALAAGIDGPTPTEPVAEPTAAAGKRAERHYSSAPTTRPSSPPPPPPPKAPQFWDPSLVGQMSSGPSKTSSDLPQEEDDETNSQMTAPAPPLPPNWKEVFRDGTGTEWEAPVGFQASQKSRASPPPVGLSQGSSVPTLPTLPTFAPASGATAAVVAASATVPSPEAVDHQLGPAPGSQTSRRGEMSAETSAETSSETSEAAPSLAPPSAPSTPRVLHAVTTRPRRRTRATATPPPPPPPQDQEDSPLSSPASESWEPDSDEESSSSSAAPSPEPSPEPEGESEHEAEAKGDADPQFDTNTVEVFTPDWSHDDGLVYSDKSCQLPAALLPAWKARIAKLVEAKPKTLSTLLQRLGTVVNSFAGNKMTLRTGSERCCFCRRDGVPCYSTGYSCAYCNITKANCPISKSKEVKVEQEDVKVKVEKSTKDDNGEAAVIHSVVNSATLASAKNIHHTVSGVIVKLTKFAKDHVSGIQAELLEAHISHLSTAVNDAANIVRQLEDKTKTKTTEMSEPMETAGSETPEQDPVWPPPMSSPPPGMPKGSDPFGKLIKGLYEQFPDELSPGSDPFAAQAQAGPGPSTKAAKKKRKATEVTVIEAKKKKK